MFLKTPDVLTKKYGIAAERGSGPAVPREIFAFATVRHDGEGQAISLSDDADGQRRVSIETESGATSGRVSTDGRCSSSANPASAPTDRVQAPRPTIRADRAKSTFLSVILPMCMARVLPEYGGDRKAVRYSVSHQDLADSASVRRETMTRHINQFISPASHHRRVTPQQKQNQAFAMKLRAYGRGHKIRPRGPRPDVEPVAQMLNKQHRFAATNIYGYAIEDPADRKNKKFLARLIAGAELRGGLKWYWDTWCLSDKGQAFKNVPEWIWDAKLPVSLNARLVMTVLWFGMLGQYHPKLRKWIGEVHPYQSTLARMTGLCISSVRAALREWEEIGLIRVVQQRGEKLDDGSYRSGPAKIVWLPLRQFSQDEAARETERMAKAIASLPHGSIREGLLQRIGQFHRELLEAYTGKERVLAGLWSDLRRALQALRPEGLTNDVIRRLVPHAPLSPIDD